MEAERKEEKGSHTMRRISLDGDLSLPLHFGHLRSILRLQRPHVAWRLVTTSLVGSCCESTANERGRKYEKARQGKITPRRIPAGGT